MRRGRAIEKGLQEGVSVLTRRLADLRGPVTRRTAIYVVNRLLYLAAENPEMPILMEINSPGGAVVSSLEIVRLMDSISCPIITFCRGEARHSAAAIAGHGLRGFRAAAPDCRFSFSSAWAEAKQEALPELMTQMLLEDGSARMQILDWLQGGAEFDVDQALHSGLIDAISPDPLFPAVFC